MFQNVPVLKSWCRELRCFSDDVEDVCLNARRWEMRVLEVMVEREVRERRRDGARFYAPCWMLLPLSDGVVPAASS